MKTKNLTSDIKLLQQHGITKQVIILLNRNTLSSVATLKNEKSHSTNAQPRRRSRIKVDEGAHDDNDKLLKLHGITKKVSIRLCRIKCQIKSTLPKRRAHRTNLKKRPLSNPYRCPHPNCTFKAVYYSRINEHLYNKHATEKPFKCRDCSHACKTTQQLEIHRRIHSDEKLFPCSFPGCTRRFRHASSVKLHLTTHSDAKPFKCSICGARMHLKQSLRLHMLVHDENRKKSFKCPTCDYVGYTSFRLKVHIRRIHIGIEKPFKCPHPQCKYAAICNSKLKDHLQTHSANKDKPFSCSFCNYKAIKKTYLNRHMRRHTGEKPYSCSQCNFKGTTRSTVTNHFARHHTGGLRKFQCVLCSKAYFTKNELVSHFRTHTGEKPFACKFCRHETTTSGSRDIHERICTKRPDGIKVKPYKCLYCDHTFAQIGGKQVHERSCKVRPDGLVIQPYTCQFCNRKFTLSGSKILHEKRCKERPDGDRIENYKCQYCDKPFVDRRYWKKHETRYCKKRLEVEEFVLI